jgi:folate-binding protein YgfZ
MKFVLSHRRIITVSGQDSADFLQGIITQNIDKVATDSPQYSCILTPQGKFLDDFFIFKTTTGYSLTISEQYAEQLIKKLNMYKLGRDISLSHQQGQRLVLSENQEHGFYHDPRGNNLYIGLIETPPKPEANHLNLATYHNWRMAKLIVDGDFDIPREKGIILEYDLYSALDFTKGCYMGQELIARTHHRGLVRKKLFHVKLEVDKQTQIDVANNNKITTLAGKDAGKLVFLHEDHGYALIKHDYIGQQLLLNEISLQLITK